MVVSRAAPKPLASYIGDQDGDATIRHWKHIEIVAAHLVAGPVNPGDGKVRKILQPVRHQRLLNHPRDSAPAPAAGARVPARQPRVVQNAGGLRAERIQNLAVQRRKGGRASGIEINRAKQLAPPRPSVSST